MTTTIDQKPGCLTSFLSLFGWSKPSYQENLPYRLRDDFLSPAEFSFYKVLVSLVSPRQTVLTKVRLGDIFYISRPNENFKYINRISQRHVDFLLCDPKTMKPVAGIELDDSSHNQRERRQRDEFVDQVFLAAGVPLLHVPVKREYSSQEINSMLTSLFRPSPSVSIQPTIRDEQESATPICPKCGIPMVLRTASQGDHRGQQFYGCQNYPRCRVVLQTK